MNLSSSISNFACDSPIIVLMNVDIVRHLEMAFPTQYCSHATHDSGITTMFFHRLKSISNVARKRAFLRYFKHIKYQGIWQ